jgi:predicted transcriptional regulator
MDSVDPNFEDAGAARLGPLERQIHHAMWVRGPATVREMLQDGQIWQSYSTIMTTMDRLFRKGLLDRVLEGKAFRYAARCSPEELDRVTAMKGIRQLLGSENASLHLSYFVEAVGAQDEKLLDELQALVKRQRAQLQLKSKKGERR